MRLLRTVRKRETYLHCYPARNQMFWWNKSVCHVLEAWMPHCNCRDFLDKEALPLFITVLLFEVFKLHFSLLYCSVDLLFSNSGLLFTSVFFHPDLLFRALHIFIPLSHEWMRSWVAASITGSFSWTICL